MPTRATLDFQRDHALARDAIYAELDAGGLEAQLRQLGLGVLHARSLARDRREYLNRPDLGRSVAKECVGALRREKSAKNLLTIVVADGLSAKAAGRNAAALIDLLRVGLEDWDLDEIVVATQARVALGDAIGELRGAEVVLVLIGERPGLTSPDSLGAYLTYEPRVGRTDAERNCISNIRPEGLSVEVAALRLKHLLREVRTLKKTGVALKDTFVSDNFLAPPASDPS